MIYIVILLFLLFLVFILIKTKFFKTGCVTMINGAPKTGKSSLAVNRAIKEYKKSLWKYRFKKYLLFNWKREKPLLYSNIPLTCSYVEVTEEMLRRQVRLRYCSIMYLSEMSLIADSMSFKDGLLNEQLQLFIKLFGHETLGGKLIIDTQSIEDNHYAVKRCTDKYLYIHRCIKFIPFILILKVREMVYSSDNQHAVNVFNEDIEESMKTIVILKSVWKKFDAYCYSIHTDNLPVADNVLRKNKKRYLKQPYIVSFKNYATLKTRKELK